jgi:hypothetical protein
MSMELRLRNQSQQLYVRALSQAWRNSIQTYDPSVWLLRDAEAEEKMLRDADIAHAVGFRRHLIAGRQWELTPTAAGSPRADIAVAVGTELLGKIKHFTDARLNLARAFFSGSRFSRIHGTTKTMTIGDGKPRTWWYPVRLEDMDKRMYRIVPDHEPGEKLKAHWERWDLATQQFVGEEPEDALHTIRHVYQDDQATLGHGRALREALGWWWYAKEHVFQEALQAAERYGGGMMIAKINGLRDSNSALPNSELLQEWVDALEDMRARHVMAFDKDDDIQVLMGGSEGWQYLQTLLGDLRSTIFTLVLGANLTTSAEKGGSYALAEVQENSTEALVQYDRETLEETLTDDLLGCVWYKNHPNLVELGIAKEKPRFAITQEKKEDPMERVQVMEIANRMGLDLAKDDVYEQIGMRKPEAGEEIVKGGSAQPANPFPGGGGGFGPFKR